MQKINLKRGAGTFLYGSVLMMLGVLFFILIMEYSSISYNHIVADTRSDLIADSTAVYAQSFDYKYNQAQAKMMCDILTEKNNEASDYFNISSELSFPSDDVLTVECLCETPTFYKNLINVDKIVTKGNCTVRSVDAFNNVLYVPDMD